MMTLSTRLKSQPRASGPVGELEKGDLTEFAAARNDLLTGGVLALIVGPEYGLYLETRFRGKRLS